MKYLIPRPVIKGGSTDGDVMSCNLEVSLDCLMVAGLSL